MSTPLFGIHAGTIAIGKSLNGHGPLSDSTAEPVPQASPAATQRLDGEDFIVALAHELRGPLAAISSAAALLNRLHGDGADGSQMVSIIQRQVLQLVRLVDDLLDVGRLSHGKLRCEITRVRLREAIQIAVEMHHSVIDKRRLRLEVHVGESWVWGDPTRLVQILSNLLDNATKFSSADGRICLTARSTEAPDRLALSVLDEGDGIAAAKLDSVFDLYEQATPRNGQAAQGLGVGLTIVRGLVEQQGGTISVRSDGPGQGSEFVVTLKTCDPPANPLE